MNTPTEIQFELLSIESSTEIQLELLEVATESPSARQAELRFEETA